MITLGNYTPDSPSYGQHSTVANNCVPYIGYYSPFYAGVAYTDASIEAALTAFSAKTSSGTPFNFIGGVSKLQKITSAAWEDLSKVGGYTTSSETKWGFTTFGDRVIATNNHAIPQSYVMGVSTDFADLDATAPIAKVVATVRGFVMFGNISGYPTRVHWSALENPTSYTPSVSTQCDYQDLYGESEIGEVRAIVGGEYATIFMDKAVFRGTYVGGDVIFQFDQVIRGNGTPAGGSVASFGDMIFYLGNDGFYMLSPAGLIPIGEGAVNRMFFSEVIQAEYWRICSVIDPKNSLYIIGYPTETGVIDKLLIYNWVAKRWSTVTPGNMETLFNFYAEGVTLETADALVGDPDTGPYADVSIDSALFIGGKPTLAGVDQTHIAVLFDGAELYATIETGEVQINKGYRSTVTKVSPMVEGDSPTITVNIGYRNNVQSAVSYSDAATVGSEGEAYMFQDARFHRAKLNISGAWTKAYGIEFEAKRSGKY